MTRAVAFSTMSLQRSSKAVPGGLPDGGLAVGPGFRVPLIVASPWVEPGSVLHGTYDHTSILQFIERNYSTTANPVHLPTISPARRRLDDLTQVFNFAQQPIAPALPSAVQLFAKARQTVLTLDLGRTLGSLLDHAAELAAGAVGGIRGRRSSPDRGYGPDSNTVA